VRTREILVDCRSPNTPTSGVFGRQNRLSRALGAIPDAFDASLQWFVCARVSHSRDDVRLWLTAGQPSLTLEAAFWVRHKQKRAAEQRVPRIAANGFRFLNLPLSSFAGFLRSPAGRPVVDKTGIAGNYDFTLSYALENDTDSPLPSFFTALQEQFGLKLEATKVPLELVVIDHVEKIPSEN
jgi:uncharacterized protein (TIGR03435 family)